MYAKVNQCVKYMSWSLCLCGRAGGHVCVRVRVCVRVCACVRVHM